GLGILLVEQNASRAIAIADKTYLLQEGRVALEGGREILSHPDIRKIYLGG
ncbi:MAG: ABC transporter ATP-binding protein, partial [Spirochaetia bacterium]|nr:ABC transporter ATP-binding protein [Spirochaetia bacterium]